MIENRKEKVKKSISYFVVIFWMGILLFIIQMPLYFLIPQNIKLRIFSGILCFILVYSYYWILLNIHKRILRVAALIAYLFITPVFLSFAFVILVLGSGVTVNNKVSIAILILMGAPFINILAVAYLPKTKNIAKARKLDLKVSINFYIAIITIIYTFQSFLNEYYIGIIKTIPWIFFVPFSLGLLSLAVLEYSLPNEINLARDIK